MFYPKKHFYNEDKILASFLISEVSKYGYIFYIDKYAVSFILTIHFLVEYLSIYIIIRNRQSQLLINLWEIKKRRLLTQKEEVKVQNNRYSKKGSQILRSK